MVPSPVAYKRSAEGHYLRVSRIPSEMTIASGPIPPETPTMAWKRTVQEMENTSVESNVQRMTKRMRLTSIGDSSTKRGSLDEWRGELYRPLHSASMPSPCPGIHMVDEDIHQEVSHKVKRRIIRDVGGSARNEQEHQCHPPPASITPSYELAEEIATSLVTTTPFPRKIALNIVQKSREQKMAIVPYEPLKFAASTEVQEKKNRKGTTELLHNQDSYMPKFHFGTGATASDTDVMETILEECEKGDGAFDGMDVDNW